MNTSFMIGCSASELKPGTVLYSNPSANYQVKIPIIITNENLDILKNATLEITCKWYFHTELLYDDNTFITYNKRIIKLNNGKAIFTTTKYVSSPTGDVPEITYVFQLDIVNGYLTIEGYEYYFDTEFNTTEYYGIAISEVKFVSKG